MPDLKIDNIDIPEVLVIAVLGAVAIINVVSAGNTDIALPIATGLTGYLTKSLRGS